MWKTEFEKMLPYMGHRNWILIVDKAFPLQTAAGMTFLDSERPMEEVVEYVWQQIAAAPHLKPVVYLDRESRYLDDTLCPGAEALFTAIGAVTKPDAGNLIRHDEIFRKMDEASKLFATVVIKTSCTIPYSSVFIELDCGYWDAEREKRLRERI